MNEAGIPQGHVRIDGRYYVTLELFEAANKHVLEQGLYCNQLIATLNDQGAVNRKLEAERLQLLRDLNTARAELKERDRTITAMRAAVYGASEGL
ncbi:hypothetical protein [Thiocystis violacea]|uniref:hypothetical protein n=1 Tax=Thiocystis violacea TaxID=13725 RepID=UPI00190432DC|nr:hypothetical protein [Thiocystis violacea]MBK1720355.1 hypothetical protein [Thiocystis violacea]